MTLFLFLLLNIVFLAIAVVFLFFLAYTLIIATNKGSPYAPTRATRIAAVLEYAEARPEELLVDLGSGNGGVLIAAAERGIRARGVEINPFWVWYSRRRILRRGLGHLATVVRDDLFTHPFADANIIFMYLVPPAMERLAPRIRREAAPGTRVVVHRFPLPGWTPVKQRDAILLYHV
ncbi:MAG: hypothetical protein AAB533_00155 [Patescibacteria group bacterium]